MLDAEGTAPAAPGVGLWAHVNSLRSWRRWSGALRIWTAAVLVGCGGLGGPTPAPPPPSAVLATLPSGASPTLLAVAPDGRHVYAASNGSLTVIDTTSRTTVATLPVNPNSTGIAVAPDGSRAYIASLFSINLTVLDTASNTLGQ